MKTPTAEDLTKLAHDLTAARGTGLEADAARALQRALCNRAEARATEDGAIPAATSLEARALRLAWRARWYRDEAHRAGSPTVARVLRELHQAEHAAFLKASEARRAEIRETASERETDAGDAKTLEGLAVLLRKIGRGELTSEAVDEVERLLAMLSTPPVPVEGQLDAAELVRLLRGLLSTEWGEGDEGAKRKRAEIAPIVAGLEVLLGLEVSGSKTAKLKAADAPTYRESMIVRAVRAASEAAERAPNPVRDVLAAAAEVDLAEERVDQVQRLVKREGLSPALVTAAERDLARARRAARCVALEADLQTGAVRGAAAQLAELRLRELRQAPIDLAEGRLTGTERIAAMVRRARRGGDPRALQLAELAADNFDLVRSARGIL